MDNVYYDPEKFGLRIIGALDEPNLRYEFNTLVVWQHEDGRVVYATESGGWCPTPFEYFRNVESLSLITPETLGEFEEEVRMFPADEADREALIRDVWALVPRASA